MKSVDCSVIHSTTGSGRIDTVEFRTIVDIEDM